MYRIKIIDKNMLNTYKWYNDAQTAHLTASIIVNNKDADAVEVMNLKTKQIEKIYFKKER